MDLLFMWLNAAACGLISVALIGAIISPRVHDGVIIKVGLICMAAGFGAISLQLLDGVEALARPLLLINAGIAVAILGYLTRRVRARHPVRRTTDWFTLMEGKQ